MELVLAALPFLAFLACPLMMLVCVFGMRRTGCSTPRAVEGPDRTQTRDQRVAALEGHLAAIRAELAALRPAEVAPAPGIGSSAVRPEAAATPGAIHAAHRPA